MKDIRIAAVICNSLADKTRHNLDDMVKWITASKNQGAAVVCFPEMNVTGYSNLADIKDSAEPVPGPVTRDLLHLAESERIIILAGVVERDDKDRIFASHLVLKPDGFLRCISKTAYRSAGAFRFYTRGRDSAV